MKKIFIFIFLSFLFPVFAQAAEVSFVNTGRAIVGEPLKIEMWLNTVGQNVNALEAKINWPSDKLELVAVEDNLSIISLWIKDPKVVATSTGEITLAGLIPSGYSEPIGQIITLTFRPSAQGQATITAREVSILLNDGLGTPVATEVKALNLKIKETDLFNQHWLYILFLIIAIIISIFIWQVFRQRKKYFS